MGTKRTLACIVSGVLVSTSMPGCGFVTVGRTSSLLSDTDTSKRQRTFTTKTFTPSAQNTQWSVAQIARSRRLLGQFTMRAYTQYENSRARTASGTVPTNGRTIAVDPRVIPLGTVIEIEGIGRRVAEDTGGRIKGRQLDLFLPSVQACTQFGVRSRNVYVID